MIHIGRLGQTISKANLAQLNNALAAVAGETVTAGDVDDLIAQLEIQNIPEGGSFDMQLASGKAELSLCRILGGWNVASVTNPYAFEMA